jgi:hypothetical protein
MHTSDITEIIVIKAIITDITDVLVLYNLHKGIIEITDRIVITVSTGERVIKGTSTDITELIFEGYRGHINTIGITVIKASKP